MARRGGARAGAVAAVTALMSLSAIVHGPVAKATPNAVSLTTSSSSVAPLSTIDLTASMPVTGAGTVSQEIVQQIDPTKVKLTSASDITYPNGWSLSYSFDSGSTWTSTAPTTATGSATSWDMVTSVKAEGPLISAGVDNGRQIAEASVSGATGIAPATLQTSTGDGWQVFFDPQRTRAFDIYHGQIGQLDCWVIATGDRCAGFPFFWDGDAGPSAVGRVVGTNIWIQGMNSTAAKDGSGGLFCVDISAVLSNTGNTAGGGSPTLCTGGQINARGQLPIASGVSFNDFTGVSPLGSASETQLFVIKLSTADYRLNDPATIYCVDTATKSLCPTSSFSSRARSSGVQSFDYNSLVRWGDRLYVSAQSTHYNMVSCVLISTGAFCPGWAQAWDAYAFDPRASNGRLFELPNASGEIGAVCYQPPYLFKYLTTNPLYAQCWNAAGTRFESNTVNFPRFASDPLSISLYGSPVRKGARLYFANGNFQSGGEIICYDATVSNGAGGACPGVAASVLTKLNYTVTPDPLIDNCMWVTQHNAPVVASYNMLTGAAGCGALVPPEVTFTGSASVPRMGCSTTSAIGSWQSFTLQSTTGTYSSATLTVKDSDGNPVSGWTSLPIAVGSAVDLSGLSTASTGQQPDFVVSFDGTSGSVNATAKIRAVGDAPQLCTEVTALVVCPSFTGMLDTGGLVPGTVSVSASGLSTDAQSQTTQLTPASASVTISVPSASQCGGALQGRATDAAGGLGNAVPDAVVSLLDSTGAAITYPSNWSDASKRGLPITATTDASGNYSFTGLAAANYKVSFANASTAVVQSSTVVTGGSGTTSASGGLATSNSSAVTVGGTSEVNGQYAINASATADTSTGGQGVVQTISPMTNDTASTGATKPSSGAPVKLCDPLGSGPPCALTSVVVAGEGTYTANANGTVTFTPCSAAGTPAGASCTGAFTGTATSVPYTFTDSGTSSASSTITATVVPVPVPVANTGSGAWNVNQDFTPFSDDTPGSVGGTSYPLDATSVKICTSLTADASCTATANVVVPNEGTWSVVPSTGVVTFDPLPSFSGTASPLKYCVADSLGQRVCSTITPTVVAPAAPSASPDSKPVAPGGTVAFPTITGAAGANGAAAGQSTGGLAAKATPGSPDFVNASTCLLTPGTSTCDADGVVAIAGEGTYTLNTTTGVVTFAADANATQGTKTPINYRVTDQVGNTASSTLTPVIPPPPTATADTETTPWDTTKSVTVLGNDAAGTGSTVDATSVKICTASTAHASCTSTSNVVVPNEGTWSVNPASGVVSFDPLATFTGTSTIKYCMSDASGQRACTTASMDVTVPDPPTASPETKSVAPGATVAFSTITGSANGSGLGSGGLADPASGSSPLFVNASTCLLTPGTTACDADGVVVVAGEGTYTLNAATGVVTFAADANATEGAKTPISYRVTDQVGNTASSTLTPLIPAPPVAINDTSSGGWDSNQTITVTGNDSVSATPSVVTLCSTAELAATPVVCTQSTLIVANEGTYTVNGDGSVMFDPLPTFTGTVAAPPTYQVADAAGQKARALIAPTVAAPPVPVANPDSQVVAPVSAGGTGSVTFDPLIGSGGLASGAGAPTVCLIDPSTSNCAGSNSVTIAGSGTYVLDPLTKVVTFTLESGVTAVGSLSPVTYRVTDSFGQTATSTLTPIIPSSPSAAADTSTGYQDVNQVIPILGNDAAAGPGSLVPGSVKLCDPSTSPPQVAPNCAASSVNVSGEGSYSVNANGTVTFDPDPSFTGTAAPLSYQVSDSAGLKASSTITPTVVAIPVGASLPIARDDTKTGAYGQPMTFTPIAGTSGSGEQDAAGSAPATVTSGSTTTSYSAPSLDATSVRLCSSGQTLPGCSATSVTTVDGTYAVNGDGAVTFTPAAGFTGTATAPVAYQVSNAYTRTVATTVTSTTTTDPTASCLSPGCSFAAAPDANSVAPGGAGYIPTWTVADTTTSDAAMSYAASALLTPTVSAPASPSASPDSATTTSGTPVNVSPWTNDTAGSHQLRPGSILLCAAGQTAPACTATTVAISGQGIFSVDTATGVVTFTPEAGFTGSASVPYRIVDWNGTATHSTITISVTAASSSPPSSGGGSATPSTDPDSVLSPDQDVPNCSGSRCTTTNVVTQANPTDPSTGPSLRPQRETTTVNSRTPVALDPMEGARPTPGHRFTASSIRIFDGRNWVRTFNDPAVGTWRVTRGTVEFRPARGFVGTAIVPVRAIDTSGAMARSKLHVLVAPDSAAANAKPGRRPDVPTVILAGRALEADKQDPSNANNPNCPDTALGGAPVATITVDDVSVPVKRVTYPRGGTLEPPATNSAAGISARHASLTSQRGTSVLTWHSRYGRGCDGALNSMLAKNVGDTFTIKPRGAKEMRYVVTRIATVPQGDHPAEWFDQNGPHRLALITCTGLKGDTFTTTTAIFATAATR